MRKYNKWKTEVRYSVEHIRDGEWVEANLRTPTNSAEDAFKIVGDGKKYRAIKYTTKTMVEIITEPIHCTNFKPHN
jgi:hypothetical protein